MLKQKIIDKISTTFLDVDTRIMNDVAELLAEKGKMPQPGVYLNRGFFFITLKHNIPNVKERYQQYIHVQYKTASKEHFRYKWGELLWEIEYQKMVEFQGNKNTFKEKQKQGWSKEQFDEYNNSRASTKENFIKRLGEVVGTEKWEEYTSRQRYTTTLEYFIEREGNVDIGRSKWIEHNRLKSNTLDVFIHRYGDNGEEKYLEYVTSVNERSVKQGFYTSSLETSFFDEIEKSFIENPFEYGFHHKQLHLFDRENKKSYFYDFASLKHKTIVELYGDYWHCNPQKYNEEYFHKSIGLDAKSIWKSNQQKIDVATEYGWKCIIIWESEWNTDKEKCIERIKSVFS